MQPGNPPDASKLYFFLKRFGIRDVPLTPLLAARVAARRRAWFIEMAGVGAAAAVIAALYASTAIAGDEAPLGPVATGLVITFLGLAAAVVGVQAHQHQADRRIGRSWPQQESRPTVDKVLGTVGGPYLAATVFAYYGGLALVAATIHATRDHLAYELMLYGFGVGLLLFAVLQAVLLLEVIRRPTIGGDWQSLRADDVVRQLDIRRLLLPYPALLAMFPGAMAPAGSASESALHSYAAAALLGYVLAGLSSTALARRAWRRGGRQLPVG